MGAYSMKLLAFLEHMRIKYETELDEHKKPEEFNRKSFVQGILFFIKKITDFIAEEHIDE